MMTCPQWHLFRFTVPIDKRRNGGNRCQTVRLLHGLVNHETVDPVRFAVSFFTFFTTIDFEA